MMITYTTANSVICKEIKLSDRTLSVQRLPIQYHYELISLHHKMTNSDDMKERLDAIFKYIQIAAGVNEPECINVSDIPELLNDLIELNEHIELLPWQITYRTKTVKSNLDYDGRELATIVSMLATCYGWSQEEIHKLQPEVVACYVQEILMQDWHDKEFSYKLSRIAYDENGKYVPLEKPAWYTEHIGPTEEEAKAKVPMRFVPDGVVIDETSTQTNEQDN